MAGRGVVAAGHPVSARAGADVLAAGGNAVDAAVGAMLAALSCEPLLTGLGAGGYLLAALPGRAPALLDFFVETPGREGPPAGGAAELVPVDVSFGDAVQTFHVGAASAGTYGFPAGVCAAVERFGTVSLAELCAPAAALADDGVALTAIQAHVVGLLRAIVTSTAEAVALFAPAGGPLLREGQRLAQPELAAALRRLGTEGAAPFYTGDVGERVAAWIRERGGALSRTDLAAYRVQEREPLCVAYRGRAVLTNPPPAPGGLLLARALSLLDRDPGPPGVTAVAAAMRTVQAQRTPQFAADLADPGFPVRFLASRLGSTTHVAALDADGGACSVTCSNGEGSGVIVPGTGVHLNNMLGESDLNPDGFGRHPVGARLPSMMSPTIVCDGGPGSAVELAVGSAGSNRIRSAILQAIIAVVDRGRDAQAAVDAPRIHYEDGGIDAEPGIDLDALRSGGWTVRPFRARNLYFGGVQAAARTPNGGFSGGGDPRRGGAAVIA